MSRSRPISRRGEYGGHKRRAERSGIEIGNLNPIRIPRLRDGNRGFVPANDRNVSVKGFDDADTRVLCKRGSTCGEEQNDHDTVGGSHYNLRR